MSCGLGIDPDPEMIRLAGRERAAKAVAGSAA